ncbi:hypothetical protein HK102_009861 [Quaeritorhiza haematococci]|nr:hypothetical protein HK102_009861 [Quaeritorhiza haematococci]
MALEEFRSKKIRLFKNGDVFTPGKKLVVSSRIYRNYEQASFLHSLSNELQLLNGAVRKVYALDGTLLHGINQIQDGGCYIATAGESFRKVAYQTVESGLNANRKVANDGRAKRVSQYGNEVEIKREKELPLFGPLSKAYRIIAFANGDFTSQGVRITLNYRNCKSFENVLRILDDCLKLKNGHVRKVFDAATGRRVKSLRDLQDGQAIVATASEALLQGQYRISNLYQNAQEKKEEEERRVITFFPNGDSYHNGWTVLIKKNRFPSLKKLLDHVNDQIEMVGGLARNVFTTEGQKIQAVDELVQGRGYVLVANNDPFMKVPYNLNHYKAVHDGPIGLAGTTTRNELMKRIRWPKQNRKQTRNDGEQMQPTSSEKNDADENLPPLRKSQTTKFKKTLGNEGKRATNEDAKSGRSSILADNVTLSQEEAHAPSEDTTSGRVSLAQQKDVGAGAPPEDLPSGRVSLVSQKPNSDAQNNVAGNIAAAGAVDDQTIQEDILQKEEPDEQKEEPDEDGLYPKQEETLATEDADKPVESDEELVVQKEDDGEPEEVDEEEPAKLSTGLADRNDLYESQELQQFNTAPNSSDQKVDNSEQESSGEVETSRGNATEDLDEINGAETLPVGDDQPHDMDTQEDNNQAKESEKDEPLENAVDLAAPDEPVEEDLGGDDNEID